MSLFSCFFPQRARIRPQALAFLFVCALSLLFVGGNAAFAQLATLAECKAHLQYIASDKLMGRMTGTPGNDEAARYIAEHFRKHKLTPPEGMTSYFQRVPFVKRRPTSSGVLLLGGDTLVFGRRLAPAFVKTAALSGEAVFVGFGVVDSAAKRDDYAGLDVRGKIVVAQFGENDSSDIRSGFRALFAKREIAEARGAAAFIELFTPENYIMWGNIMSSFKGAGLQLADRETKPRTMNWLLAYDGGKKLTAQIKGMRAIPVSMTLEETRFDSVFSNNVVGVVKGSDSALSKEYVLLSAHYDHIGTGKSADGKDSIYNGARDNGMGTTALLAAAKYLAANPPKRSVLFLACTGEEMGLLGSSYYAANPAVPHKNVIFNLNADGAGFNDTSLVTIIGLGRTTAKAIFEESAKMQGLTAKEDPAPEQNLFDRSDNVSFARLGIPAPTFSAGFKAFDAEINKYYHQLGDEAGEDFDFPYLTRYVNTFITAARRIADAKDRPRWLPGDKYEAAFKKLYSE
jgi:hypothetical protein